ncbi:hypothetical protein GHK46_06150 [Sinorhizobium medicae]|uniref:hypothetical protein n=1 Tax=Sinorhizobium medicae TaxID=110321 RepID=UPI001294DE81|nr:hypothetical protein [Sinorhizobium medicae]MQV97032.1 hypothetical protein [Sinorhizobium medicae]
MKLSKRDLAFLAYIQQQHGGYLIEYHFDGFYYPAEKLLKAGLLERRYENHLHLTAAVRSLLLEDWRR